MGVYSKWNCRNRIRTERYIQRFANCSLVAPSGEVHESSTLHILLRTRVYCSPRNVGCNFRHLQRWYMSYFNFEKKTTLLKIKHCNFITRSISFSDKRLTNRHKNSDYKTVGYISDTSAGSSAVSGCYRWRGGGRGDCWHRHKASVDKGATVA